MFKKFIIIALLVSTKLTAQFPFNIGNKNTVEFSWNCEYCNHNNSFIIEVVLP